jgi:perosamine synthetase
MRGLLPTEWWQYSLGDFIRGLAAALDIPKALEEIEISGLGKCIPVRSARAGIIIALKALGLATGSRIGVPLYCCPVVFKAIKTAGYKSRFIDVNLKNGCVSLDDVAKKLCDIDALIAVHMFGNVCDMQKLREIMGSKPIIEDCAQSIGSRIGDGMTGSFGDIGVLSFRSGKYLSVGEGGALFSKDRDIYAQMLRLVQELPRPGLLEECKHVVRTYIRSSLRSVPLYGLVGHGIWQAYNRRVDFSAKAAIALGRIYRADLATAVRRLARLDAAIEKQRYYVDLYQENLRVDTTVVFDEPAGAFVNRYLYPIVFPSQEYRNHIAASLHRINVDTSQPYKDVAQGASEHYEYTGDCPVSEYMAERILAFPNYAALKKGDVITIANCINRSWGEIASGKVQYST